MKISKALLLVVIIGMIYSFISTIATRRPNWIGFAIFLVIWGVSSYLARKEL